jgi:hypothetical protein
VRDTVVAPGPGLDSAEAAQDAVSMALARLHRLRRCGTRE